MQPKEIKYEVMAGFEREKQVKVDIVFRSSVEDVHGCVAVSQRLSDYFRHQNTLVQK